MQIIKATTGIDPIIPFKQDSYCESRLKQFNTLLNGERVMACCIHGCFARSGCFGHIKSSKPEQGDRFSCGESEAQPLSKGSSVMTWGDSVGAL